MISRRSILALLAGGAGSLYLFTDMSIADVRSEASEMVAPNENATAENSTKTPQNDSTPTPDDNTTVGFD